MFVFVCVFFFLMLRLPPRSTRTDTLFPYTTLFRSLEAQLCGQFDVSCDLRGQPHRLLGHATDVDAGAAELARLEQGDAGAVPGGAECRGQPPGAAARSEEHTSELQSLMRISYAVFCLKKKKHNTSKLAIHTPV